jgi:rare lipoprotein A
VIDPVRQLRCRRERRQASHFTSVGFPGRLAVVAALSFLATAGCARHVSTSRAPVSVPPAPGYPSPSSGAPPTASRQPAIAGSYVEEGVASWYGVPFNGRRTSNGEIYDMHELTAAHRTLPFGAMVRVTNLQNGKQIDVRITDRGPFVGNRVIDLSLAAAQSIDMIGPGTAQVRLEIIGGPSPQIGYFGVQVGAFRSRDNAERLGARLEPRYPPISIANYDSPTGTMYRLRVGRVATQQAATRLAEQLKDDGQATTFVVRLDP